MPEGNLRFRLHAESFDELSSILTEYAQMKRVVRQHDQAETAELIRNTLYAQHANSL